MKAKIYLVRFKGQPDNGIHVLAVSKKDAKYVAVSKTGIDPNLLPCLTTIRSSAQPGTVEGEGLK